MHYVIDTSVILSDPKALERLGDKHIVLPLVVLTELEAKRNHPELGYPARTALRMLEDFRKANNTLTDVIPRVEGGSIRVEINHVSDSSLPDSLKTAENDNRILAVASNLAKEGLKVTLLTKDLPLRLKAAIANIEADDYDVDSIVDDDWSGIVTMHVSESVIDEANTERVVDLPETEEYPIHTGIILKYGQTSLIGRIGRDGKVKIITANPSLGLQSKNAEQSVALDILCDDHVGIASLGGLAGSGKTVMALAAGIDAVVRTHRYKKVIVFRPVYSVGQQDLGFLPGTAEEKMLPWASAVYDAMEAFLPSNKVEEYKRTGIIQVLPLTHIRGRTLKGAYVIIDEAQNLDMMTLVTTLSRMGDGSKVVLTHDVNQRDNLRVGKHDGIARIISTLSHSDLFAHVSLVKSERSAIAELVATSFDL